MMTFDVANILTSMMFIKRVRAICGLNIIILTDGAPIIGLHAGFSI